jgi:CheY-like chemotaxis protein
MLFDLMMPGLDGVAVYQALAARHPSLLPRLAFLTGGAFGDRAADFLAGHDVVVLQKPLQLPKLLRVVDDLASAGG